MTSILQNRTFRQLFIGQAFCQFGTAFSLIVIMAQYRALAGDSAGWPLVLALKATPHAVLGPLLGLAADRLNRRGIIMASNLARFGLFLLFPFCTNLIELCLLVFLTALGDAAYLPAYRGLISTTVEADDLLRANSLDESIRGLLGIVGIAFAAGMLDLLGLNCCLGATAATYLISAATMIVGPLAAPVKLPTGDREPLIRQCLAGFAMIWSNGALRRPVFLWLLLYLIVGFEAPLFLPLIEERQWGGASEAGYLYAAISVGMLLAALWLTRHDRSPLAAGGVLSVILFVDAATVLGIALLESYWLVLAICFLLGITDTLFRTYCITEIQLRTPPESMGRVFATISMLLEPAKVLAMLVTAMVLSRTTASEGFLSAALFELALWAIVTGQWVMLGRRDKMIRGEE